MAFSEYTNFTIQFILVNFSQSTCNEYCGFNQNFKYISYEVKSSDLKSTSSSVSHCLGINYYVNFLGHSMVSYLKK